MEKQILKPRIKKPPFFKSGSLVFDESGHKLTLSDGYYRCIKNSNRMCNKKGELQIKAGNIEKSFCRLVKKFSIDGHVGNELVNKITKENLFEILIETDERESANEEIVNDTITLMKKDVEMFNKFSRNDNKDFEKYFTEQFKASYPVFLFGQLVGLLRILAHPEREAELGRNFSMYINQVRITNDGKICSISFEPWAWYAFSNILDKNIPNYLDTLKRMGVVILNKPEKFHGLSVKEVALSYGSTMFNGAMGENFTIAVGLIDFMKKSLKFALHEDPHEIQKNIPLLLEYATKNPIIMLVTQIMIATNTKVIESKNQSDPSPSN